jgi:2'-hydroxyisoflavone reductase
MKILILGGTRFAGRNLVEVALAQGHEITLFNRGKTNPDLFPTVEHLRGDRDGDLASTEGRQWDVVVDTCGYVPRIVQQSARLLADNVQQYIFISTLNVYADVTEPGIDETAPLATIGDRTVEEVTPETYGALKVLCEQEAEEAMPGRVLVLRCGLIVGPYDPTDRFTYWVVRVSRGGEMLALSPPRQQTQFIDARDLAAFIVHMAESNQCGIYNTTGPDYDLTNEQLLKTCNEVTGGKATFTWVTEDFIEKNEINLPLWVPEKGAGLFQMDCKKAIAAGLRFRPLRDTVRDTLVWHQSRPADYQLKAGLSPEREKELLRAWHEIYGR